jgi:hypothetical protein
MWEKPRSSTQNRNKPIQNHCGRIILLTSPLITAEIEKKMNFDDETIQNENYHFCQKK